jgi:hypothetical protein
VRRSTRVSPFALDLHVLGTPPAFVLSQDQTLQLNFEEFRTGIVEARLRDSRLRCSGRSLNRLTPTRIGAPSEIDCGFRNPSSLGLLFGFQRPSRLSPPRLSATVFPLLGSTPLQPRGRLLYFEAAFLSSGRCRSASTASPRFRFDPAPLRLASASFEGARNLLRFRLPCQPTSSTLSSLRLGFLHRSEGLRLLPPPR